MADTKIHEYIGSTLWNWFRRTILDKKDDLEKESDVSILLNHDAIKVSHAYANFGVAPSDPIIGVHITPEEMMFHSQKIHDEKILQDHIPDSSKRDQIRSLIRARASIWGSFFKRLIEDKFQYMGRDANSVEVIQLLMGSHSKDLEMKLITQFGISQQLVNGYQRRIYKGTFETIRSQIADMIKKDLFQRSKIKLWYQIFNIYEESIYVSLDTCAKIGMELFEERRKK